MYNFAIIGLGFISDRHIQAIKNTGNKLIAVCDIDKEKSYKAPEAEFFTDFWDMYKSPIFDEVNYVSICTPNYLHSTMVIACLLKGKKVICEKPPVISMDSYFNILNENNADNLSIVFQCRYTKELTELKEKIDNSIRHKVKMQIELYRDNWYMESWKAKDNLSGGLLYNIGCHYFDILTWFFGDVVSSEMTKNLPRRCEGIIEFNNANVEWTVSIDAPIDKQKRIFEIDGKNYNLTQMGFEELHTKVYEEILKGNGFNLKIFDKTINLIEKLYGRD